MLFLIVMDAVTRHVTENKSRGIVWKPLRSNKRLESVDYADDKCELSHNINDIQQKLAIVYLKINVAKPKGMS